MYMYAVKKIFRPGEEEEEGPRAGRGQRQADDLSAVPADEAEGDAQDDEHTGEVEDEFGRSTSLQRSRRSDENEAHDRKWWKCVLRCTRT